MVGLRRSEVSAYVQSRVVAVAEEIVKSHFNTPVERGVDLVNFNLDYPA